MCAISLALIKNCHHNVKRSGKKRKGPSKRTNSGKCVIFNSNKNTSLKGQCTENRNLVKSTAGYSGTV